MVVAIDGPSGVGKSTVSRAVAQALNVPYLDTGSYYRAATLIAMEAGADPADEEAVLSALRDAEIGVVDGVMLVSGRDVTEDLRGPDVTAAVSVVAAHARVRSEVVELQRRWVESRGGSAVVEGRDIGTVVFPDAEVKVFLTADTETRAARRAGDAEVAGHSMARLQAELERRDEADSTRSVSPLRPASDAVTIDTTDMSVADVVLAVLDLVGTTD